MSAPRTPDVEELLARRLVAAGRVAPAQLAAARSLQARSGGPGRAPLGEILIRQGLVSVAELEQLVGAGATLITPGNPPPPLAATPRPLGPTPAPWGPAFGASRPGSTPAPTSGSIELGGADPSRRLGRYVLVGELGRGGMGSVHRGWDPQLRRDVAIKRIHETGSESGAEALARRFLQEARAAARLRHEGIVAVHEVGTDEEGRPYLVMDLVEGETLADLADRERLAPRRAATIVRDLARALDHAHGEGVVHRDVKPQNVLIDGQGRPRLVDFGLARLLDGKTNLTRTGQMIGTPHYVSPEQARGRHDEVGPRSDVWALGAVLYWGITGRTPFTGENILEVLKKVFLHDPDPPRSLDPAIHPDLETVALRCLEKDPDRRYDSAAELAAELDRFLDGAAIRARPIGRARRMGRWARRRPVLATIVVLLLLVAGGGAGASAVLLVEVRRQVAADRASREARAREEAAGAWERFRSERTRAAPDDETAADRRARVDGLLALGFDAVQLAAARHGHDRDEPDGRRALFEALLAYGEVALVAEQWSLAATVFEKAGALEVDADRAGAAAESVEHARTRFAEERRAVVEAVLADARSGELERRPDGREGALFTLVRYAEPQTVDVLVGELDRLTDRLRSVTREVYLGVVEPTRSERAAGETAIAGVEEAVDRFLAHSAGEAQDATVSAVLQRAGRRLVAREAVRRPDRDPARSRTVSPRRLIAAAQHRELGAADLLAARLCCQALGRIGIADRAVAALGRHLLAEADESRAIEPAIALCLIGGDPALAFVDEARRRFGFDGPYWQRVSRYVVGPDGDGATPDAARSGATDAVDDEVADPGDAPPLDADEHFRRGIARIGRRDFRGAIADFDEVVKRRPDDVPAIGNRGYARRTIGDLPGAIADFDRVVELRPGDPKAWLNRGALRYQLGELAGARSDLDRAVELAPGDAAGWSNRAMIRIAMGDSTGAIADLDRAFAIAGEEPQLLVNRGQVRLDSGDPRGALVDFDRALELDPEHAKAWSERGRAKLTIGDVNAAKADLRRATELDPRHARAHVNLGIARRKTGDLEGALVALDRAVLLQPELVRAYRERAELRVLAGEPARALEDFDRVLAARPDDAEVLVNRCLARSRTGDADGAIADATRAIELRPKLVTAWLNRGLARGQARDFEGSLRDLDRAAELSPDDPRVLRNRGITRDALGDAAGAAADFERYLELEPGAPFADQIRERIAELRAGGG